MAQTVSIEVEIPSELFHELQGHVAQLDSEEQTRLQSAPYRHSKTAQWLLENAVCSRRNLPETVGTDVEISDRGEVIIVSEGSLLG